MCRCNEGKIDESQGKSRIELKHIVLPLAISLALITSCTDESAPVSVVDHVSTLVGTMSKHSLSTGNTYPAIAVPWGANFWTPQTGSNGDGWTYVYSDDKIRGIKQTHQPSPWINDWCPFSFMPVTTGPFFSEDERASWFSHKAEKATPYYYKVYLGDHDTTVEITPTSHAASARITYPERDMSYLVVDAFHGGSCVKVDGKRITGYTTHNHGGVCDGFRNWFVIESDTDFDLVNTVSDGTLSDERESVSGHSLAMVGFSDTKRGQTVNLRIASSFISLEQAVQNLSELGDRSFDEVKESSKDLWNSVLGRIEVEDDNIDNVRTFYSCLYRSVLFPRDISETTSDGKIVHMSPYDGKVHAGHLFTDTGVWDTFRSLFALVDLLYPEVASSIQEGFVNHYLESGFLPEWSSPGHRDCMVGNNTASVVAEAYLKGIRGYDIDTLWEALIHDAHAVHPSVSSSGRIGWEYYDSLGYVPCNVGINENAARTLEYAYDDWAILQLGKALGKSDDELAPYARAAMNYRNVFNPEHGLMQGRRADGSFPERFSPYKWGGDFTEGNSLHYTWSVFHDPCGLASLMGGEDAFARTLDSVFEMPPFFDDSYYGYVIHEIREMQIMDMGNYAHGNQPAQHMLYLYDWCRQPWKTQYRVRDVMSRLYSALPDGYCGDEDNGQTSAWYVFSALGFYPANPASCEYALGSPLFDKAVLHLAGGKDVKITAKDNNSENVYVSRMKVDGRKYTKNYLTHRQLLDGAEISFVMSSAPDTARGTTDFDIPYSFSKN